MSESTQEHENRAAAAAHRQPVRCAILTISDTRTPETDAGGDLIERFVREAGHEIRERRIVRDDAAAIDTALRAWLSQGDIEAILCTGGTGIAARDTTVEVVRRLLSAELEGFGELFRMLSWHEIGPAAMLSRAAGGLVVGQNDSVAADCFIFAMPGSPNAVELAMKRLIGPQLAHLVWERRR